MQKQKCVWAAVLAVVLLVFAVFVVQINRVDRTELVSRTGHSFEKGVVTEVLRDNLQPDGTRVGEQLVKVKMLTGVRKARSWKLQAALVTCSALAAPLG